jgi:hypothetical protein
MIGRKVAKQQKPYYHSYYYYCVTAVAGEQLAFHHCGWTLMVPVNFASCSSRMKRG